MGRKILALLLAAGNTVSGAEGVLGAQEEASSEASAAEEVLSEGSVAESEEEEAELPPGPEVIESNGIDGWPLSLDINSETGCLMDAETGVILFNKEMDRQMYPASITKIMTSLLAIENNDLDEVVEMTEAGVEYVQNGSASLWTVEGEEFTVEQLLYGTLIKSANDMATQLGEYTAGSVDEFVDMMNERAEELGCLHTNFENACGMPNDDHMTTAHDMALITQEAIKNETFMEIIGTEEYSIPPTNKNQYRRSFDTHVKLIYDEDFKYDGILGGKTGYTDAAGNTLVTFAERDGRTLICVTMKGDGMDAAAEDHVQLLDYGFDWFENRPAPHGDTAEEGGLVSVPKSAKEEDLTLVREEPDEEGMVRETVLFHNYEVGHMVRTAEDAARIEAEETPSPEPGPSVTNAPDPDGPAPSPAPSETVTIAGYTMSRRAFCAIAALGGLVLAGVLLIVITLILKKKKKE